MTIEYYNKVKTLLKYAIAGTEWEGHVYTVGGCERDRLMGREIKDIDIVIDLPNGGIRFAKWLEEHHLTKGSVVVYENYGTAMFRLTEAPDIEIEAVQTRKECYRDLTTRNPETAFGTIEDDCHRRDFTYNAIYFDITNEETKDFGGNGLKDLLNNILRTCGEPDIIYKEDPLRILRAIRFGARFGSKFEVDTLTGMHVFSHRLEIISKERIQDEVFKILMSRGAKDGLELIFNVGAMPYVFPLLKKEDKDIYLSIAEKWKGEERLEVRLASLLYDTDIKAALKYLKCSNDLIEEVENIAEWAWRLKGVSEQPLREQIIAVRKVQFRAKSAEEFDRAAMALFYITGDAKATDICIHRSVRLQMEHTDMFGYILPINGDDVMTLKNIEPSRKVAEYLEFAMAYAYAKPEATKEELLNYIKDIEL